jgi:hypothetical protein
MASRTWALNYPEDENGTLLSIPLRLVDMSDIPAEFAGHEPPAVTFEEWLDRDPMFIHREYNWFDRRGRWQRRYAGIGNGRHRILLAESHGYSALPVHVLAFAFWPFHARPADRADMDTDECFVHPDFLPASAGWVGIMDPHSEERRGCPTPDTTGEKARP